VYCGFERIFLEVSIDKGVLRYYWSKNLVSTDSARSNPPCPPDLVERMEGRRQSSLCSGRMPSLKESTVAHGSSSHAGTASASVPSSPPAAIGHASFSAPLGAQPNSHDHNDSERNGASGCSLSDELPQVSGREPRPAERASAGPVETSAIGRVEHSQASKHEAGPIEVGLQSQGTLPHSKGCSRVDGTVDSEREQQQPEGSDATAHHFSPFTATAPLDVSDVTGKGSSEEISPLAVSACKGSVQASQQTTGLLTQEFRKVRI
jgi:hypothetical protein